MEAAPFVEDVEGPGTGPGGAGVEEIVPDHLYARGVEVNRQRGRQVGETCFEAGAEGGAHPVFPGEGEGAFFLLEDFGGEKAFERCAEEGFGSFGADAGFVGQGAHEFDEGRVEERDPDFE